MAIEAVNNKKEGYAGTYNGWKNKKPYDYQTKLESKFGQPEAYSKNIAYWRNIGGFKEVIVRDELINHASPKHHLDYLYCSIGIKGLNKEHVNMINIATESVQCDLLKGEATARCSSLIKNAVTLGFLQDIVNGNFPIMGNVELEYAKRILMNKTPDWFEDELGEKKE